MRRGRSPRWSMMHSRHSQGAKSSWSTDLRTRLQILQRNMAPTCFASLAEGLPRLSLYRPTRVNAVNRRDGGCRRYVSSGRLPRLSAANPEKATTSPGPTGSVVDLLRQCHFATGSPILCSTWWPVCTRDESFVTCIRDSAPIAARSSTNLTGIRQVEPFQSTCCCGPRSRAIESARSGRFPDRRTQIGQTTLHRWIDGRETIRRLFRRVTPHIRQRQV